MAVKKYPALQVVAKKVKEQVRAFEVQAIQAPLDRAKPLRQVAATLEAVQVAAPDGLVYYIIILYMFVMRIYQTTQAPPNKEYPELQDNGTV